MKCYTPEIAWHNREPVLSVDIHIERASDTTYRLASSGADTHIVIWLIHYDNSRESKGVPNVEAVCDLARHQKAVNVVRFSPSGELLASGDDESVIIIWKKKSKLETEDVETGTKLSDHEEHWTHHKTLRFHLDDVYDISWSPDSTQIISGSVDNTAILWNVITGNRIATFSEHRGFVQGVSWDPLSKYVATLSSDRTLRVYSLANKTLASQCSKAVLPEGKEHTNTAIRIFHDDTLKTYFRRLCFSPDGLLLIVPSGVIEPPPSIPQDGISEVEIPVKPTNTTYIFLRDKFTEPIMYYPSGDQFSVVIRCCPVLFKRKNTSATDEKIFDVPYRIVFAVATKRSIILYDTEHAAPFAYITDVHYTRLTDLTWSADGSVLVASSTDGFCTVVTFSAGELGELWKAEKTADSSVCPTSVSTMETEN